MKYATLGLFLLINAVLVIWLYGASTGDYLLVFSSEILVLVELSGFLVSFAVLGFTFDSFSSETLREPSPTNWADIGFCILALGTAFVLICTLLVSAGLPYETFQETVFYGYVIWTFGALILGWRLIDCLVKSIRSLWRIPLIPSSR